MSILTRLRAELVENELSDRVISSVGDVQRTSAVERKTVRTGERSGGYLIENLAIF